MAKINEYPQAVTINNNDLFVIDQESGGDHATKSASVSQIADKATSGVQSQIGNLSSLTTTDKSSIVGAVNEKATIVDLGNIGAATKKLTFTGAACRYLVISSGGSNGRMGAWWVMSRFSSISYIGELLNSNVVSLSSANDGELVITSTSANTYVQLLLIAGTPSDFTIT